MIEESTKFSHERNLDTSIRHDIIHIGENFFKYATDLLLHLEHDHLTEIEKAQIFSHLNGSLVHLVQLSQYSMKSLGTAGNNTFADHTIDNLRSLERPYQQLLDIDFNSLESTSPSLDNQE